MSAFRSSLVFEDDDGLPYTLIDPLLYDSDRLRCTIYVPAGFKTDLASIPRGLWNLLPKSGRYDRAAVVHDWLYATGPCSRADADAVLNEAMGVLGVGTWTRRIIYAGVRLGGWSPWGAYRRGESAHV